MQGRKLLLLLLPLLWRSFGANDIAQGLSGTEQPYRLPELPICASHGGQALQAVRDAPAVTQASPHGQALLVERARLLRVSLGEGDSPLHPQRPGDTIRNAQL